MHAVTLPSFKSQLLRLANDEEDAHRGFPRLIRCVESLLAAQDFRSFDTAWNEAMRHAEQVLSDPLHPSEMPFVAAARATAPCRAFLDSLNIALRMGCWHPALRGYAPFVLYVDASEAPPAGAVMPADFVSEMQRAIGLRLGCEHPVFLHPQVMAPAAPLQVGTLATLRFLTDWAGALVCCQAAPALNLPTEAPLPPGFMRDDVAKSQVAFLVLLPCDYQDPTRLPADLTFHAVRPGGGTYVLPVEGVYPWGVLRPALLFRAILAGMSDQHAAEDTIARCTLTVAPMEEGSSFVRAVRVDNLTLSGALASLSLELPSWAYTVTDLIEGMVNLQNSLPTSATEFFHPDFCLYVLPEDVVPSLLGPAMVAAEREYLSRDRLHHA